MVVFIDLGEVKEVDHKFASTRKWEREKGGGRMGEGGVKDDEDDVR